MDNASIHHSAETIRQLCADAGVILVYLPPYSPSYNPVEGFISELKAFVQQSWGLYFDTTDRSHKAFREFLIFCTLEVGQRRRSARSYFWNADLLCEESEDSDWFLIIISLDMYCTLDSGKLFHKATQITKMQTFELLFTYNLKSVLPSSEWRSHYSVGWSFGGRVQPSSLATLKALVNVQNALVMPSSPHFPPTTTGASSRRGRGTVVDRQQRQTALRKSSLANWPQNLLWEANLIDTKEILDLDQDKSLDSLMLLNQLALWQRNAKSLARYTT